MKLENYPKKYMSLREWKKTGREQDKSRKDEELII